MVARRQWRRFAGAAAPRRPGVRARATAGGPAPAPRVAIVGAGVCGPALALLLRARLGVRADVYEAAPAIVEAGAGISLAPNGMRVLASLGLAERLIAEVGEPVFTTRASRPDGSTIVTFPTRAVEQYGLPMIGFRRARLRQVLLDGLEARGIPLHLDKRLASLEQPLAPSGHRGSGDNAGNDGGGGGRGERPAAVGPAVLTFEDGSTAEADLVVGADGLRSPVRRALFGKEQTPRYTGAEVVFAVSAGRHPDLVPPNVCEMVYGPGRHHFGAYGLASDCTSWFTSRRAPESPDSWGAVPPADVPAQQKELLREFEGWVLPQALIGQPVAAMIKVGIYDRDPVKTWTRGTVTLAGDAASPIPPNLGQGGNKALEDAGVLTECLALAGLGPGAAGTGQQGGGAARSGGEGALDGDGGGGGGLYARLGRALAAYERARLGRAAALLDYSRQAGAVADLHHPLARAARNTALKAVVALNGTLPSGWMWEYDSAAAAANAAAAADVGA